MMVGAAFLLLALLARAHVGDAHHSGGIKQAPHHQVVGYGCIPQTVYETQYHTKYEEAPIYKTLSSNTVVVEPFSEVLHSTIHRLNTVYVTKTEQITTTVRLTKVSHERLTETVSELLYVPDYSTATQSLTQYQPAVFTKVVYTTDVSTYVVTTTQVETVFATVTDTATFTLTHKSQVPVATASVITSTAVHYVHTTLTHTHQGYPDNVLVTSNVIQHNPTYLTRTEHLTQTVTTTNIERVPHYVTKTVTANCGFRGYYYPG